MSTARNVYTHLRKINIIFAEVLSLRIYVDDKVRNKKKTLNMYRDLMKDYTELSSLSRIACAKRKKGERDKKRNIYSQMALCTGTIVKSE